MSCGVFVCVAADRWARGAAPDRALDVQVARDAIRFLLQRQRFDHESFNSDDSESHGRRSGEYQFVFACIDLGSPEPVAMEIDIDEEGSLLAAPPSESGRASPCLDISVFCLETEIAAEVEQVADPVP